VPVASTGRMADSNELERTWNEVFLAKFLLKYKNFPGGTRKKTWKTTVRIA
jgi:hypothetical protein